MATAIEKRLLALEALMPRPANGASEGRNQAIRSTMEALYAGLPGIERRAVDRHGSPVPGYVVIGDTGQAVSDLAARIRGNRMTGDDRRLLDALPADSLGVLGKSAPDFVVGLADLMERV